MPSMSRTQRGPLRLAALLSLCLGTLAGGLLSFVLGLGFAFALSGLIHGDGHRLIGLLMVVIYVSLLGAPVLGWITYLSPRPRLMAAMALGLWPVIAGAAIALFFAIGP